MTTITAATKSTGARTYRVIQDGLTAEISRKGCHEFERVPCALAADRHGTERVLVLVGQRWIDAGHRTISMLREIEDANGDLPEGALAERLDAALGN